MEQETFFLTCKNFQRNLSSSLFDLLTEHSFSDVTLVSDDHTQVQAHKFVLSASSPVLRKLLLNNPHDHPLLYLRGVKHQELQSLLRFMYIGEVKIYRDRIHEFLNIAKDLKVKDLTQESLLHIEDEPVNIEDDSDANNHVTRNVSGITDEILDLDIPENGTCSDELNKFLNIEDDEKNDTRIVSETTDELIGQETPNRTGGDELGSNKQLFSCTDCELVYKTKLV